MTDAATTVTELTPASPTPVTPPVDIEALIARMTKQSDDRVAGLMSSFDKRIAEQERKFRQQSGVIDDEPDDSRLTEERERADKAEREAAMLRAGLEYPDVFPDFQRLLDADPKRQLEIIRELKAAATPPAPPAEPPAEPEPAPAAARPIDPNNPPRTQPSGGNVVEIAGKATVVNDDFVTKTLGFNPFKRG